MPSAEEILRARDEPVAEKIAVDYAEEQPAVEREPGEEPAPQREPGERPEADDEDGRKQVPIEALHAERNKSKRYTEEVVDLRRQIAELTSAVLQQRQQPQAQPQAQAPPEFDWDNPLATVDQRYEARIAQERAAIAQEFQRQREAMQSQFAISRHTEDVVKAAYKALAEARETDPNWGNDYRKIMQSPDQYEAMVQWHKQRTVLQEVGPDPEAYKARIRAEYLEELRTGRAMDEPRAEAPAKPASVMPSNLSGARSVSSRNGAAWSGPSSIKDILGHRG